MNYRMVVFVLGRIFVVEAAMMLLPMVCSAIYGEWYMLPAFLLPGYSPAPPRNILPNSSARPDAPVSSGSRPNRLTSLAASSTLIPEPRRTVSADMS